MDSYPLSKLKAPGLSARKWTKLIQITFHDDVFLSLNFGFAIWVAGREVGEESLSVFSNGGMTHSHVGKSCT